ncbi:hypothetical protein [Mycolicibacterium conceptionense]|nr:hypothetical protein [Mycolicibacterium conceptionense]
MGYADELFDLTDKVVLVTGGSRGLDVTPRQVVNGVVSGSR